MHLATVKQALYISPKRLLLTDDEHLQARGLLEVLAFVDRRLDQPRSGVFKLQSHRLLFWPHLFEHSQVLTTLATRLLPPTVRAALPAWDSPASYARWCAELRTYVLAYLRMLVIPPMSTEGRPLREMYRHAFLEPGLPELPQYADDTHYTVFRWVRPELPVAQRLVCQPRIRHAQVFSDTFTMPGALLAVYAAWSALTNRAYDPFDPIEVGVEFTSTGHLFVNWERFSKSRFWPTEVPTAQSDAELQFMFDEQRRVTGTPRKGPPMKCLRGALPPPRQLPQHLAQLPCHCRISDALIDIDLKTERRVYGAAWLSPSANLCREMAIFDRDQACSLIDPVVLLRPNLFSGLWHTRHWSRTNKAAKEQRKIRAQIQGSKPLSSSKVRAFSYCPADYLDDFLQKPFADQLCRARRGACDPEAMTALDQQSWPFANDYRETIYAVKKKGQLCFTYPRGIRDFSVEMEVWHRFLDLVHLEERAAIFDGNMDVYTIERPTDDRDLRSEYYKDMSEQVLYEELDDRYRDMIARGGLEAQRLLAETEHAVRLKHQNAVGGAGSRWFFEEVLPRMRQSHLAPEQLRIKRRVVLPGRTDPQDIVFFTGRSVDEVRDCAFLSMRALITQRGGDDIFVGPTHKVAQAIEKRLSEVSLRCRRSMTAPLGGSAPLLLAWARFCDEQRATLTAVAQGPRSRMPHDRDAWTLPQDIQLLTTYRRYPRFSAAEIKDLCDTLGRDAHAWQQQVQTWKKRMEIVLHHGPLRRLDLGCRVLSVTDAWRVVLHWAIFRMQSPMLRKTYDRTHPTPVIQRLWRVKWSALEQLTLPTSYYDRPGIMQLINRLEAMGDDVFMS